ncbi:8-oxo-dGTP pyrophosphatase MutT (NUDIX family) [Paenibacillus castaneae]|uniref:NUDIX hydrolase n=1 Tax=Paenibacillus castaneae TaxID=474957 RepID=UPI000C9A3340|nr:NUDIX domain-containing protein [Paenibacillus castaneae]NIK75687.1 8-oxo-dGTP pyrophosphatase MutT (NUDIX family) [Paenibacillus castaneae]
MFVVNVEGAIFREDKWLVVERGAKETHAPGGLAFVGGKVEDEGSSVHILERTLKREIDEEVGAKVKEQLHYVRSTSFIADDGNKVIDIVFLCEFESGEPWRKCPDEVEAVFWMTCDEIMAHPEAPIWLRENLECAESIRKQIRA